MPAWVWWIIGGVALLLIVAYALTVLPLGEQGPGLTAGDERPGVTVEEITDSPSAFYGRTVAVSGDVEQIITPQAFTIGSAGDFAGDSVLVVGASGTVGSGLQENSVVQVTGMVQPFDLAAMEAQLGTDLDDNQLASFASRPVIIANTVTPTGGT